MYKQESTDTCLISQDMHKHDRDLRSHKHGYNVGLPPKQSKAASSQSIPECITRSNRSTSRYSTNLHVDIASTRPQTSEAKQRKKLMWAKG